MKEIALRIVVDENVAFYATRLSALNLREKLVAAEENIHKGRVLSEEEAEAEIAG